MVQWEAAGEIFSLSSQSVRESCSIIDLLNTSQESEQELEECKVESQEGTTETIFLFGLRNQLICNEILCIFFEYHWASYESLDFLCTLQLVCKAWRH
jgi:hypothetical protein